ncbi:MAG: ribokinase [Bacteroidota bacterium]
MEKKIVVIGSSNIDLIMKVGQLPEKGETVIDGHFLQVFGGKGANQAVAAARAGGEVAFVNCVGDDANSPQMLRSLEVDGIDIQYVFQEEGIASGHALIMVGGEGENYISVASGANGRLDEARLRQALPLITQAALIVLQFEIPEASIAYILQVAEEQNIPVLWNVAPALAFDKSLISKAHILVVNEVEAAFLSGLPVHDPETARLSAAKLLQSGLRMLVVTLGKAGAILYSAAEEIHIPAFVVDAVDTTAAGDVFCGSLAVAYVEEMPLPKALRFASAAAAIAVTRMGAQPSAPHRHEIEAFLSERKQ